MGWLVETFVKLHKIVFQTDAENLSWKFALSILKNNKVLCIPKKNMFCAVVSKYAKIVPKDGACCPNFQWRFCGT